MNYQGNNVLICVSLPTTVFYSCNVWPSGSRFHGQHMAVWIFRFHGCSRSLFRHEPHSWCSQRVSSIRQCFASGNWECPKSSSPSPPSHFFFSSNQCCNFTLYYSDRVHIFFQLSIVLTNWKLGKGYVHSIFQS